MFRRRRNPDQATPGPDTSGQRGVEFGWKTHSAINEWTAKVDSKAAIVLSLGGLLLGFIITLSSSGRPLADLQGWHLIVGRVGVGLTALGVLLAAFVVTPRLNRRHTRATWKDNFIYFGHLRHWKPANLRSKLKALDVDQELDLLATQLVGTAKIAWYKHSLLQFAMASLVLGVLLVVLSAVWPS